MKMHLCDTMSAFGTWDLDHATSERDLHYRQLRDTSARILEKDRYCAACGKKIKVGARVYRIYVSWGRRVSQCACRPIHTRPCIPLFTFTLQTICGDTHTYATNAFNHGVFDVETVGEPDVRTAEEAKAWIASVRHTFENDYATVQSYTVTQDGQCILSWDKSQELPVMSIA